MLDWTDRFYRYFFRLISTRTWLYTEMVTTGALIYGDRQRFLRFDASENPIALQLGGSTPADLARCARFAADWGYDEVNLNVGCPSERVQSGAFGACLMAEPHLVADCLKAMQDAVEIPVTIKHRIGINEQESYDSLRDFVGTVANQSGCKVFIVHARNAILKGLSPKENRDIPPLKYDYVYRLKADFPALEILINGGITTGEQIASHLQQVDGVMVGREAYHNPWRFIDADARFYGDAPRPRSRADVIHALLPFIEVELAAGVPLKHMTRHLLGLFQGMHGAKNWRRTLSDATLLKMNQTQLLLDALSQVTEQDATLSHV